MNYSSNLPLSKIKKISKLHPKCQIITSDACQALTIACENFILLFAREAYRQAQLSRRKTIQMKDIDFCIREIQWLEFLDGALEDWPNFSTKAGPSYNVDEKNDVNVEQNADENNDGTDKNGLKIAELATKRKKDFEIEDIESLLE